MGDFEQYHIEGQPLERVTSVISVVDKGPALMYWYGKHGTTRCRQLLKESQEFGTELHSRLEQFCRGVSPGLSADDRINKLYDLFVQWFKENDVEVLAVEQLVHCRKLRYAGTFDLLARVRGKVEIVDYKTSADFYNSHALQTMAYKFAVKSMGMYPGESVGRRVIRLGREDKKLEEVEFTNDTLDLKGWFSALRLYWWRKETDAYLKRVKQQKVA